MAFITWLDLHAGAVQAASAVVAVFLTAVVARLTSRYVALTALLTESARQQVEVARLNAEASAALQKSAEQQLAAAAMRQRDEDARRKSTEERARRLLESLCARLLNQFAPAPASEPSEGFFRHTPAIEDADIALLRDTALDVPGVDSGAIEGLVAALNVLRDLHEKTRAVSRSMGYAYNEPERMMYKANLGQLRRLLESLTPYRPAAQL